MSTSGVYTWQLQRNAIVSQAFKKLGLLPKGQELAPEDLNEGITQLNSMVKSWQSEDIYLWKFEIINLFLQYGQNKYVVGPGSGTDHATLDYDYSYLASAASAGATSITVQDATGFTIGKTIGVVQSSYVVFWTTIANVVGNVITLTAPLDEVAAADRNVFCYSDKPAKPLKMKYATLLNLAQNESGQQGYETQMNVLARKDYELLSVKYQAAGYPSEIMFEPRRTEGWIWISQAPANTTQVMKLNVVYPFQAFEAADNDPDFPEEWTNTLVYNLAAELIADYGVEGTRAEVVLKRAEELKQKLLDYDMEDTYLQIDVAVFPRRQWGR